MLGFGLTLLGGCVATTAQGQPSELYFLAHSVRSKSAGLTIRVLTPMPSSDEALKGTAHRGLFIAENVAKTGVRSSFVEWGIYPEKETEVMSCSLFLGLSAKNDLPGTTDYRSNVNITRASLGPHRVGYQASLLVSEAGLSSPLFVLRANAGVMTMTESYSGSEVTKTAIIPDVYSDGLGVTSVLYGSERTCLYDFVVTAYANDGLGVNRLSLPMRQLPAAFSDGLRAIFEFETKSFIEI